MNDLKTILIAIAVIVVLAVILAVALAFAGKYLKVEEDERTVNVMEKMPGVNCGACGFPGCSGFVDAVIKGNEKHIKRCAVIKDDKAKEIVDYLNTTPDAEGNVLKVEI